MSLRKEFFNTSEPTSITEYLKREFRGLEYSPDCFVISDISCRILYVNKATISKFGHSEEQFLGENVKILMPPRYQHNHDKFIGNWKSRLRTDRV